MCFECVLDVFWIYALDVSLNVIVAERFEFPQKLDNNLSRHVSMGVKSLEQ